MKQRVLQIKALAALSLLELYRRKDMVVVFLLSAVILLPLSMLTPFGVSGANRYMSELAYLLVWLFSLVIGLGVSVRLFPPEFSSRTIYPMLAKPVDRGVVLLGKYVGALAASVSALAFFYVAYAVLMGVRQGVWFPVILLQAFVLHVGFLMIVVAMGLAGSLLMTTSANLTLSVLVLVGMLIYGQRLPQLAAQQPLPSRGILILVHWLAPHAEFFDMRQRVVHEWSSLSWDVCVVVMVYAVVYAAVCLMVASRVFHRKRL